MSKIKQSLSVDKTVCLKDILDSFNSPVKEEQAWALCYQCVRFFLECLAIARTGWYLVTEVHHILLQTDGTIHRNTLTNLENRKPYAADDELIVGLGCVIYAALDRGTQNGEERSISRDLEQLINDMISEEGNQRVESSHHETDDEGIEKDADEVEYSQASGRRLNLQEIVQRCERHVGNLSRSQVESHYRAVVRALVAEAVELETFLEKVAQGTSNLRLSNNLTTTSDLDQLQFADWARFWVQVINELRLGVKLKKVQYSRAPIEYELTPYEILMKDIRSCRYNLRKIMVRGNVPSRVTKDAHAIILEFIRSRPPLKRAADRKLPPCSRVLTPREQLMLSIKKGRKLRPTQTQSRASLSPTVEYNTEKRERRLIKVDFSQLQDDEDEEDHWCHSPDSSGFWPQDDYQQLYNKNLAAYDLATEPQPSCRRYTLNVTTVNADFGSQSVPQSRPCSRQSCNSSDAESFCMEPEVARALQDELTNLKPWHETMSVDDRLSLTLEEIVHIRSVLTKAELEGLPPEGHIKSDVENRKICFLCLKTRFGIFGPWGHRCTLCKRTVCTKCSSKMNIPMEHFSSVPVVLLSPSIMCTPEEDQKSESTFSSDLSKAFESRSATPSEAGSLSRFRAKATTIGRAATVVDKMKGSETVVCHDCKMMVLQIIRTARVNRSEIRNKTLQSLTLNLSPVF